MNIQDIFGLIPALLTNQNVLIKISLILVMLVFLFFTLVLARQISALTVLVNQVSFSPVLKLIAYGTVVATLTLLLFVILV